MDGHAGPALSRIDGDRRRVLAASATLFAHDGFDGTTMATIAHESGLSLKALYAAFPSKEELFEAVIADRYELHVLPLLQVDRAALPVAERVFSLLDDVVAAMEFDRAFLLLYRRGSVAVPAKLRAAGRDPYMPYLDAFRSHLTRAIAACRPDVDTQTVDDLAVSVTATLVALACSAFCSEPLRRSAQVSATLREIFGPALGVRSVPTPTHEE